MPTSKGTQRRADGAANLEAALDYLSRGWHVLAECPPDHAGMNARHLATCNSCGKRPWHRWKHFQPDGNGRIPTATEVSEWWRIHPSSNVGLALGAIGRIDIEGPEARQRLVAVSGGDLPETLMFSSGRSDGTGEGWLYILPPDARLRTSKEGLTLGGELRFQALGAQTVLPPSRHPSRRLYAWRPGHSPKECQIAPAPAWLLNRLRDAKGKENNRPPRKGNGKPADIALALAALVALDPRRASDYDSWLKVGMALHSVDDGDAMLAAWDEWSMRSPENYDDGACECKWGSFNHVVGGITLGSLIQWAQEDGWTPPRPNGPQDDKRTNAKILLEIALTNAELWHTSDAAYATIQRDGHREHWPLRGKGYRQWLAKRFYDTEEKAIGSQVMSDVLTTLEGKAMFDGADYPRYLRVAEYEGKIYVDLADSAWRAVEIDADGWRIVNEPPVRFIRPARMAPLPIPEPGGSLAGLRPFLNIEDEQWPLIQGFIVASFRPTGPYPVLQTKGEQGSAKSTQARVLRDTIDPNECPTRGAPATERDLMIAAENGWLCAFDNLSYIPPNMSDALCRLSNGGGFGIRSHYENAEETVFHSIRPILLNGIEDVGTRSDLMDRSLIIELQPIDDDERKPEAVFYREFEKARTRIFGAVLTALSTALRNLPTVEASKTKWPRMADFAQWVVAAEPALDMEAGTFLQAYSANRASANDIALQSSPVVDVLTKLLVRCGGTFEGTAKKLHDEISNGQPPEVTRAKSWPKNARALSGVLSRIAPNLRQSGLKVEHFTEKNEKLWRFEVTPASASFANSQNTQHFQEFIRLSAEEDLRKRASTNGTVPSPL